MGLCSEPLQVCEILIDQGEPPCVDILCSLSEVERCGRVFHHVMNQLKGTTLSNLLLCPKRQRQRTNFHDTDCHLSIRPSAYPSSCCPNVLSIIFKDSYRCVKRVGMHLKKRWSFCSKELKAYPTHQNIIHSNSLSPSNRKEKHTRSLGYPLRPLSQSFKLLIIKRSCNHATLPFISRPYDHYIDYWRKSPPVVLTMLL